VSGVTPPLSPESCGERVATLGNPLTGRCGTATLTCELQRDGDTFLVKPRYLCPRQRSPPQDKGSTTAAARPSAPVSANRGSERRESRVESVFAGAAPERIRLATSRQTLPSRCPNRSNCATPCIPDGNLSNLLPDTK